MKASITGLLLVFLSALTFAQTLTTEQELLDLSKKKWQWMADKKADTLANLFHEKSVFVHMGGSWGKEQEVNVSEVVAFTIRKRMSMKHR